MLSQSTFPSSDHRNSYHISFPLKKKKKKRKKGAYFSPKDAVCSIR